MSGRHCEQTLYLSWRCGIPPLPLPPFKNSPNGNKSPRKYPRIPTGVRKRVLPKRVVLADVPGTPKTRSRVQKNGTMVQAHPNQNVHPHTGQRPAMREQTHPNLYLLGGDDHLFDLLKPGCRTLTGNPSHKVRNEESFHHLTPKGSSCKKKTPRQNRVDRASEGIFFVRSCGDIAVKHVWWTFCWSSFLRKMQLERAHKFVARHSSQQISRVQNSNFTTTFALRGFFPDNPS